MVHRQQLILCSPPGANGRTDGARCVLSLDRHEDVAHRVQRLRVKNGVLQILPNVQLPSDLTAK